MKSYMCLVAAATMLSMASNGRVVAADLTNGKPAYGATDAATGAAIRVYRSADAVSLVIDHPTVQIRKDLANGQSITAFRSQGDELVLAVSSDAVSVSVPGRRVRGSRSQPEGVPEARKMLAASPAVARAATLLGEVRLSGNTPLRQTLLVTRAVLLAAIGDESGEKEAARTLGRLRFARSRASTVLASASNEEDAAGCWDLYVVEAIEAFTDFEECVNAEQWWDFLGKYSCQMIYEIRAIGAFAFWLKCLGLNT